MRHVHLWLRAHPLVFDGLAAALVALLALMLVPAMSAGGDWWRATFPFAFVLPVALRSRHQVGALYVTAALGLVTLATYSSPHPAILYAGIVMAYSASAYAPRQHARYALALCIVVGVLGGLKWSYLILQLTGSAYNLSDLSLQAQFAALGASVGLSAAPLVIAWLWGGVVHARHAYLQEALDRASRLERERDALARLDHGAHRGQGPGGRRDAREVVHLDLEGGVPEALREGGLHRASGHRVENRAREAAVHGADRVVVRLVGLGGERDRALPHLEQVEVHHREDRRRREVARLEGAHVVDSTHRGHGFRADHRVLPGEGLRPFGHALSLIVVNL